MDFFIRGSNKKVSISDRDLAGTGGQALVFRKGDVAFKVFHDLSGMIPLAKIDDLAAISSDRVIRPHEILINKSSKIVGYTMRFLKDAYVLCELFSRDGKDRAKIDNDGIVKLIQDMQATMEHVHSKKIIVGDANELNFLVTHDLQEVCFIDTDNYQTANFPCVAIMPSIRDRHTQGFSEGTDWFACGILWFNWLVGIHPFMCPHPGQKYKLPITPERFENRMVDCISAFDAQCRLPAACNRIDVIPQSYRDWMKAMFVDRKRLPPPTSLVPIVVIYQPKITLMRGTDNFDIAEVLQLPENIIAFYAVQGVRATLTAAGVYLGTMLATQAAHNSFLAHTPKLMKIVAGSLDNGQVFLFNVSDKVSIPSPLSGEQIMNYDGRLYVKKGDQILEVEFVEMGTRLVGVAVKAVATCMLNTTKFYDGVAVQSLRDKYFINVFPSAGLSREITIPELQGRGKIVSAKYENRILMLVLVNQLGQYDRFILRFNTDHTQYDLREAKGINFTGLNFTVLDNGICCFMNEDEEVELFRNVRNDPMVKVIRDKDIDGDIRLFHDGMTVLFAKHDILYSMKMK